MNENTHNDPSACGARLARLAEAARLISQEGRAPGEQELLARCPELAPGFVRESLPAVLQMLGELRTDGGDPGKSGSPPSGPATQLGEFVLDQVLGAGGMGVVFRAWQPSLRRWVAVKVFDPGRPHTEEELGRFRREAERVCQLQHPSIVRVLSTGEQDGKPYHVLELIDGGDLRAVVGSQRRRLGLPCEEPTTERGQELAELFYGGAGPSLDSPSWRSIAARAADIADALDHAHRKGIIHRDVKPSNILFDRNGRIWLTDFGLARSELHAELSVPGTLVGTLRYMSPEQAEGRPVDGRADIYSLGATLFEILTLRPFVRGEESRVVMARIARRQPGGAGAIGPEVPAGMAAIALKALASDPGHRYRTAAEMARDLRQFAAGKEGRWIWPGRVVRALRRVGTHHRQAAAVMASLVVLLCALTGLTAWALQAESAAERERAEALESRKEAESRGEQAAGELSGNRVSLARLAWERGQTRLMDELLDAGRPAPGARDRREWEWYYLRSLARSGTLPWPMTAGALNGAAWSPAGDRIALAVENPAATDARDPGRGARGRVEIREASSGRLLQSLCTQAEHPVDAVAWSSDGKLVAAGYGSGVVGVWDAGSMEQLFHEFVDGSVTAIAWSPDGGLVAAGTGSSVRVWDVRRRPFQAVLAHDGGARRLTWSSQGLLLVALVREQVVGFELPSGRESFRFLVDGKGPGERSTHGPGTVTDGAVSPDGKLVAAAHESGLVTIWEVRTGKQVRTLQGHTHAVLSIAWSPDGRRLASGGLGGELRLWDAGSGQAQDRYRGHQWSVRSLAWAPTGRSLLSIGGNGELRVWDTGRPQEALRIQANVDWCDGPLVGPGPWNWLLWSPDSAQVASIAGTGDVSSFEYRVVSWDGSTGRPLDSLPWDREDDPRMLSWEKGKLRLDAPLRLASAVLADPGKKRIARSAGAGAEKRVEIVDASGGASLHLLNEPGPAEPHSWSPDGSYIVTTRDGRNSRVWDAATGKPVLTLPELCQSPFAWSPDGRLLAARAWARDSRAVLDFWDVRARKKILSFSAGGREIMALAWHPNGSRLAAGLNEGTIVVWDAATGREAIVLNGHGTENVLALSWSPNGRRLASKDLRGTIRVWDAAPAYDELTVRR